MRLPIKAALLGLTLLVAGCASIGSTNLPRDHDNYSRMSGKAEREELLRAIVGLRYAQVPTLLSLQQVVAGYTFQTTGTTTVFPDALGSSAVGGSATYVDRPTLTYSPLDGSEFYKEVVQPVPPAAVFFLLGSGWAPETIFWAAVKSINGVAGNDAQLIGAAGSDRPSTEDDFNEVVALLRQLQVEDAIDIRLRRLTDIQSPGKVQTVLWLEDSNVTPTARAALSRLKELLGLSPDVEQFELVYGRLGTTENRLLIQTRSMLQIMVLASRYVLAPEDHVADGRTFPNLEGNARSSLVALNILSSKRKPDTPFVAVHDRGYWYYIDDRDFASKRTFSILMLFMILAEDGTTAPSPVLTIGAG